jgi:hypothetical protein
LILKEDPITNEIGFYRTISVLVVPMPNYVELPEVIITTAPSSAPIVFPVFPGVPISGTGWWWSGADGWDTNGGTLGGTNGTPSGPGGPGSSPGSPGSGTNGGNDDDEEESGWEEPVCGGYWLGEEFVKSICPDVVNPSDSTITADSIPGILSRACDREADSVFNWGIENNFREQSFIIVKSGSSIYPKNYLPGTPDGSKTRVNYTLAPGEILLGYFHTHPVETDSSGRSFFSFNDIQEARKNAATPNYCAILECGNRRFALVIEKPDLLNRFITLEKLKELKNLKLEYNAMELPVYNTNRQQASIDAVINYFGASSICGISFYEASQPNKTIFTKLNP